MSHLQGGKVDVSLIQTEARNTLLNLLEKCPGKKAIVWDNALAGPICLVCSYSTLKEYSVLKMFPLRETPLPETETSVVHMIFIVRPKLQSMNMIAKDIHNEVKRSGNTKKYHLFFVPQKSLLCIQRLEQLGVLGSIMTIEEYKCHLFPCDSDLLTMEIPEVFR